MARPPTVKQARRGRVCSIDGVEALAALVWCELADLEGVARRMRNRAVVPVYDGVANGRRLECGRGYVCAVGMQARKQPQSVRPCAHHR
eukprot:CAMPEP_0119067612 /NCGR_PEP_ID=MMETSP1178-20130426/9979_1 /TAXON_ID=33656 /ORGANISM="unid sp, Strain CCMP2000" /LENGTH=88 /DNA_ID=CAMNT_0007049285 /DNA_START=201 /DNA_END=463 /DNA_ORIENTATION=-